ncbi:unnamed protein product [Acanthoscelides obtectus]|uniref:Uncharacterized protein n=1 Tax=Acanthoscelides obtectus TaxID=200917 RepID=A0A9P0NTF3_ACAOB|nr:unnamed protein product [Acanthoscelides obtectus]CAK1640265.1 hypothetical protein AOBTE_LOCUS11628 [Acanthoscelides obtectus]
MAEEAVRRKSQLFLNNLSPVKNTYENFVRKTLKPGKFLTTKTGAFKVAGMLSHLFAVAFFVSEKRCARTSSWHPYILPVSSGISVMTQFVLYFIFCIGEAAKNPGFWIYVFGHHNHSVNFYHFIGLLYINVCRLQAHCRSRDCWLNWWNNFDNHLPSNIYDVSLQPGT